MASPVPSAASHAPLPVWKLGGSEGQAERGRAAGQPQRVSVNGRDAVVVVATDEFDRLQVPSGAPTLHDLLSRSPLNRLEFGRVAIKGPVREADIWTDRLGRRDCAPA